MEAENQPDLIEQYFRRAIAITLDYNWRKSRREEKRLREKKKNNRAPAPRSNQQEALGQLLPQP